jgi:tocopherol cyclase
MSVFKPMVFQGNFKKQNYFEGWYLKHVSPNGKFVSSFIPGISLTKNDKHAFIQFIDGISGQTSYIKYPLSAFNYSRDKFEIWIGDSWFSEEGIDLNIKTRDFSVNGEIEYSDLIHYPQSRFSPGIMGWYSFVPFMECKHGIGLVLHQLTGKLMLNGKPVNFSGGKGYIEKDWGTSFPESWIWLHCNTFEEPDCSFTFSVAKIPWLGSYFIGHICFLYLKGKFYQFATYNKSKINRLRFSGKTLEIEMQNKSHLLKVTAIQQKGGNLKAPVTGQMNRVIKESIDSEIEIKLTGLSDKIIFSTTGKHAGMELIEKILTYF